MLEGRSTAYGDALGCGVGYGAAPSAYFLPQVDMCPLRALSCSKPMVPPLRVWPRQAIERHGSGSKAPPQLGHRPWVAASCSSCTVCPLDFPLGRFRLLARWSWFELKAAYTHLLTQWKSRILTFEAPVGAIWHLAGLIWAPGGCCPTPHISYTYGPPNNGLAMTDSSRSARACDVSLGSGGKEGLPTGTPLTAKGNGGANSPVHGSVAPGGAQGPEALSPQAQPAAGAGAPPRRARRRAQRAPSRGGKPPLG